MSISAVAFAMTGSREAGLGSAIHGLAAWRPRSDRVENFILQVDEDGQG